MHRPLDPRIERLVARTPSLGMIVRQWRTHMIDEREALIQMLIQLGHDNDALRREVSLLIEHQPATLPMGRPESD